ncbi:MAG: hypothetical protein JXA09_10555 [Anaerolineae bacterium]|nr:hypothetical protein [Anaerolineae bacterium]
MGSASSVPEADGGLAPRNELQHWAEMDARLRAEADALLVERGLRDLLSTCGDVHVTGSYVLQLMAWRDLDLYLVAQEMGVDAFFALGKRIARLLQPQRMHFRDERIAQTPGLPRDGLYWGIYLGDVRAGAWKIDLWAIDGAEHARLQTHVEDIAARVTPEARTQILRIKAACWGRAGYRVRYNSQQIYQAVLDHGVSDLGAFEAYLRRTLGCGLDG